MTPMLLPMGADDVMFSPASAYEASVTELTMRCTAKDSDTVACVKSALPVVSANDDSATDEEAERVPGARSLEETGVLVKLPFFARTHAVLFAVVKMLGTSVELRRPAATRFGLRVLMIEASAAPMRDVGGARRSMVGKAALFERSVVLIPPTPTPPSMMGRWSCTAMGVEDASATAARPAGLVGMVGGSTPFRAKSA
jgi:hypothetical protein